MRAGMLRPRRPRVPLLYTDWLKDLNRVDSCCALIPMPVSCHVVHTPERKHEEESWRMRSRKDSREKCEHAVRRAAHSRHRSPLLLVLVCVRAAHLNDDVSFVNQV